MLVREEYNRFTKLTVYPKTFGRQINKYCDKEQYYINRRKYRKYVLTSEYKARLISEGVLIEDNHSADDAAQANI